MTVATQLGYDATHSGLPAVPKDGLIRGGYTTGSGSVPWTAADWAANPDAVRYCQDPGATDHTADVLDVETGAATLADCAPWAHAALAAYSSDARPGQRTPAIYCSRNNVTPVVNALISGGIKAGVGLIVADWNLSESQAAAEVAAGSGPFPIVGIQYEDAGAYDKDVFSTPWVNAVSGKTPPPGGFPAPTGLTAGTAHVSLPLSWNPVTLNGASPVSYTVAAYGLDGNRYASQTVPGTATTLSDLNHGWTYRIRVWANGGPVPPPHAEIVVSV